MPYDPFKDFQPVSLAVTTTQVLVVNTSLPVNTVKDLVALAKAKPGMYSIASPGIGTPGHLTGELFKAAAGIDLQHVPFGGAGPAINSTVAGHTPIAFGSPASTVPQIALGCCARWPWPARRASPPCPTCRRCPKPATPDVECDAWVGCVASAAVPKDIVALLHAEMAKAVLLPDVKERLNALGFEPFAPSLEASVVRIRTESDKWAKLIRATGLKAG